MKAITFLDEALNEHREYWQEKLAGSTANCGIPLDFARPANLTGPLEQVIYETPARVYEGLRSACRNNDSLLFTLLVAGLEICLAHYNNREDIRVGTSIRRSDDEIATYNKVLVLRQTVDRDLPFQQFTSTVKQTIAEAYKHQIYPFHSIQGMLNSGDSQTSSLFNVSIVLDSIHDPHYLQGNQGDVSCIWSNNGSLLCRIEYRSELMTQGTIEKFAQHYMSVLEHAIENPGRQIRELTLLNEDERRQLLHEWSG